MIPASPSRRRRRRPPCASLHAWSPRGPLGRAYLACSSGRDSDAQSRNRIVYWSQVPLARPVNTHTNKARSMDQRPVEHARVAMRVVLLLLTGILDSGSMGTARKFVYRFIRAVGRLAVRRHEWMEGGAGGASADLSPSHMFHESESPRSQRWML